jgi:hypothetical protein
MRAERGTMLTQNSGGSVTCVLAQNFADNAAPALVEWAG